MKKLALLLCIVTLLSLCACAGEVSPSNAPTTPTTPDAPTTSTADPTAPAAPTETPSDAPSHEPTEAPSDVPSPEPDALPAEPSRVVTLDGEDITDRVIELWDYANAFYCDPQYDETAMRDDVITSDLRVKYAPLIGFADEVDDYLSWSAQRQLYRAQAVPFGRPLLVNWYDGIIYRLWDFGEFDPPGRLVDITVLLRTETKILLSMKYLVSGYVESADNVPTDADCECVNFGIVYSKDGWLVNDYEFAVDSIFAGADAVGYDGDYEHWGSVTRHFEVLTADGEDIYETVVKLWNIAQHREMEYEIVEELALKSEYLDYWLLDGFEEVLDKYYTDAGAEQVVDDNYFVYQDGNYYRRGYYKTGVGIDGLTGIYTMDVAEDRMELQLWFELHYSLLPTACTTTEVKDLVIVKEDGEWKIDSYEFIDY